MADTDLTEKQITFLEKYCSINVRFFKRKAEERRDAKEQEFRFFNAAADATRKAANNLVDAKVRAQMLEQIQVAQTIMEGRGGKTDINTAMLKLDEINDMIKLSALNSDCADRRLLLTPRVETVLATRPENHVAILALWETANERVVAGGRADMQAALTMFDRLDGVLAAAKPAASGAAGVVDGAKAALVDEAKVKEEEARRRAEISKAKPLKARLDQIDTRCQTAFSATWPPALTLARDSAAAAFTLADGDDAAEIARKITAAEALVDEFGVKADKLLGEHAAYVVAQKAASTALKDIKAHKQAAAVPYVAPEITKLDEAMAAGVLKANAFDFPAAVLAVAEVPAKSAALFKVADDVAELAAVRLVRETQVGTLPPAPRPLNEVRLAIEAAETLLTEGKAAADTGKLADAVSKFGAIPAAVEKARVLVAHAASFNNSHDNLVLRANSFASKTGDVALALASNLAILQKQLTAAKLLSTTDITAASANMTDLRNLRQAMAAKSTEIATWYGDKRNFDLRLKAVEDRAGDNGRIAIQDYYQRLLADRTRSNALVAPGASIREWAMASKIVTASVSLQTGMLALADEAKAYLALHKELDTAIKGLKLADNGTSAQALAGAETLLANAAGQKDAKDWKGANATLAVCKAQVDKIKTVKVSADKVAGAKADPALATIATDFGAAFAAYVKAMEAATAEDTGRFFQALRTAADQAAMDAMSASTATPPNPGQAETLLKQAIDGCARVVTLGGERAAFVAAATLVNAARSTLTALNTDNVIKDELDQAWVAMDTATAQNAAPGYAFGASIGLVMQAQALMTKAKRKVDAFTAMAADRGKIDTVITLLDQAGTPNNADYRRILAVELARMKALKLDIATLLTAGEAEKAKARAAEGGKLADPYTKLAAEATDARSKQHRWLDQKIIELLAFATAPEIEAYAKSNLADLRIKETRCEAAMTAKSFKEAQSIASAAQTAVNAAKLIVVDGRAYDVVRKASEDALKKLTDLRPLASMVIEDAIEKLDVRYKAAVERASLKNYKGAKTRLDTFVTDCAALDPALAQYKAYQTAREAAGLAMTELGKLNDQAVIEPAVARLRGQFAAAVAFGNQGDFAAGKTEFDLLIVGCATATKTAQDHQAFGQVIEDAKAAPSGDKAALEKQIAAARLLVADQQKQPEYMYVVSDIISANLHLNTAENLTADAGTCVPAIKDAMDACAAARLNMGLFAQLAQTEAKAMKDIDDLKALPMALFVRDALTALRVRLETASASVRADPSKRTVVLAEIEAVIKEHLRLKRAAEDQVRHVALRDPIVDELARMDRHDQRYAMKADIALARQMIATADGQAEKHEHAEAYTRLLKAQETQEAALLKAEMAGDKAPDPAAIKKILARKGGAKQLDAIVATLSDVAKKKVLRVAFDARFGCKLQVNKKNVNQPAIETWKTANPGFSPEQLADVTKLNTTYPDVTDAENKGPNIQRFYAAMADLPESDTLDNDSMLEFEVTEGGAEGSSFTPSKKHVTMREGEFGNSGNYGVGLEHELGAIEEDCKPVPSEPVSFFNWNTLHEVGHAVDDKKGFMKSRGNALAGWEDYGSNTLPIAEQVAGEYGFDAAYISAYMRGDAELAVPEPTGGATPEEWENRRVLCRMWVDRARSKVSPWESDGAAKAVTIGGRAYHESQPNRWFSYPVSERTKGVSGYQFRSPGEWFSELYAAYHTKKLNPKHPAAAWLKDL